VGTNVDDRDGVGGSSKQTMLDRGGLSKKAVFARPSLMNDPLVIINTNLYVITILVFCFSYMMNHIKSLKS